jgi:hypothetical protein
LGQPVALLDIGGAICSGRVMSAGVSLEVAIERSRKWERRRERPMLGCGACLRVFIAVVCASALFPTRGVCQVQPQRTIDSLKADETIWVTTSDGRNIRGRFRGWADSIVDWEVPGGALRTPLDDIERIDVSDPIRDGVRRGAVIGAIAGALLGLSVGVGLSCKEDCGPDYSRTRDIVGGTAAFALVAAAEGVALGALLDAVAHRRRVVYVKPRTARAPLALVGDGRLGAAILVGW